MKSSAAPDAPSIDDSEMRKRILGAAFQSFTADGYAGTTTRGIAARAKVSKRDLYALFENKQALLIACIEMRTAKMRVPGGLPVPLNRDMLATTLVAFATNVVTESTHAAVIAMFRLAISEAERSPEVAQALEECRKANRRTLTEFLTQAQSGGLLPSGDAADMAGQFLSLIWEDLMMGLLLGMLKRPALAQIQRNAAKAVDVFLSMHPPVSQKSRAA